MKALSRRITNIHPSGIRKYFDIKKEGMINFYSGTIDFDTFDYVHEAAIRAIKEDFTAYTTNAGILPLREAMAEKLGRENGVEYTAGEILVTSGNSEALGAIPLAVLDPGDEAIVFDPAYSAYSPLTELANGVPVYVPTSPENNWQPDPDAVERAITPRTKLLWWMAPAVPTGVAWTEETSRALAEVAIKHDLYVASDELYERVMFDGKKAISPASLPGMWERTFTVNGFSKGYAMTGWRVGYVACPQELFDALIKAQQYSSICAPSVSQAAALAALTGPAEPFERMVEELDRRRRFVVDAFNAIDGVQATPQEGTFYTFVDVRDFLADKGDAMRAYLTSGFDGYELPESESEQLTDYLVASASVAMTPGSSFGPGGEGWLRVSEAVRMEQLQEGMARVQEAMSAL